MYSAETWPARGQLLTEGNYYSWQNPGRRVPEVMFDRWNLLRDESSQSPSKPGMQGQCESTIVFH